MSVTNSPNMNLPVPTVGNEPGPPYAFDVNSCLTLIDQHDHSPGNGIQINPTGLNINANLSFQSNSAINLGNAVFTAQASPTTTLQALSVAPGSTEEDLWYTDSNGVAVQITNGGQLNAVPTTVSGINYAAGTFFFKQTPDSLTNPAFLDSGAITIRPNVALTTFGVTLSPPSAISSQYAIQLPLLPGVNSFLTIDNAGNMAAPIAFTQGITRTNLAQGAIGRMNVSAQIGNYTAVNTDDLITFNLIGNAVLTLYTASGNQGRVLTIKRTDNTLSTLIVNTVSSQTIDDVTSTTLNTRYESLEIVSDGNNWIVVERKTASLPAAYTPNIVGWNSISSTQVFSWREGSFLCVQGKFVVGTPNGSSTSMSLALNGISSGLLIDQSLIGSTNEAIGWYANDISNNGRGAVLYVNAPTTIGFGDNGQHSTSAIALQPGNVITTAGNTMTFFFKVPISGWKA